MSENVRDDGLDTGLDSDDGGRSLRVSAGEPSGMNVAGWRAVVAVRRTNRPCAFRLKFPTKGLGRWNSRVTSFGCETGGGVTRTVGTAAMVGSGICVLVAGFCVVGLGKTEKMKFKRDRVAKTCGFCCSGC